MVTHQTSTPKSPSRVSINREVYSITSADGGSTSDEGGSSSANGGIAPAERSANTSGCWRCGGRLSTRSVFLDSDTAGSTRSEGGGRED